MSDPASYRCCQERQVLFQYHACMKKTLSELCQRITVDDCDFGNTELSSNLYY